MINRRYLLSLVGAIVIGLALNAGAEEDGCFTYSLDGWIATITGYTCDWPEVYIPARLPPDGVVVEIGFRAFSACANVTVPACARMSPTTVAP